MNNLFVEFKNGDIAVETNVNFEIKKELEEVSFFVGAREVLKVKLEEVNLILLETGIDRHTIYIDEDYFKKQEELASKQEEIQDEGLQNMIQEEVINVLATILTPEATEEEFKA